MFIIGTKLSMDFYNLPHTAFLHIHQPLRNHQRNPVLHVTQPAYNHLQHIKAFPKNFMAVCELRINSTYDCHLIVIHCFICHLLIPFHPSGKFNFYVFICIPFRHHLCHLFFIRQASCDLFLFSAPTKTDFRDS